MFLNDEINELSLMTNNILKAHKLSLASVELFTCGGLAFSMSNNCEGEMPHLMTFGANSKLGLSKAFGHFIASDSPEAYSKHLISTAFTLVNADIICVNFQIMDKATSEKTNTVCLAWAVKGQPEIVSVCVFNGSKKEILKEVILQSLQGIINIISDEEAEII